MPPTEPTPPTSPSSTNGDQARQAPLEPRWLSLEQIRKQQRCRRSVVIAAMESGQLPYERRGRIRYARVCDVEAWELSRLTTASPAKPNYLHVDLAEFL